MAFKDVFGKLVAEVDLDTKKYDKGLRVASSGMTGFAEKARLSLARLRNRWLLVSFAITAVTGGILKLTNAVDDMAKASKRMGITTDEFQRLSFAADLSGASVENLETAMTQFTRKLSEAEQGSERVAQAFKTLEQVSGKTFNLENRQKGFIQVAKALSEIQDETLRAKLALELLGSRSAAGLLPLINGFEEGLAAADRFNVMIGGRAIGNFEAFKDSLSTLATTTLVLFAESLEPVIIMLTKTFNAISTGISKLSSFTQKIKEFAIAASQGLSMTREQLETQEALEEQTKENAEAHKKAASEAERAAARGVQSMKVWEQAAKSSASKIQSSFEQAFAAIGRSMGGNDLSSQLLGIALGGLGTVVGHKAGQFFNPPPKQPGTPAKALGGTAMAGIPTVVGERGPEEVIFGSPAQVIPNDRLGSGGGSGAVTINQTLNIMPDVDQKVNSAFIQNLEPFKQLVLSGFNEAFAKNQV